MSIHYGKNIAIQFKYASITHIINYHNINIIVLGYEFGQLLLIS